MSLPPPDRFRGAAPWFGLFALLLLLAAGFPMQRHVLPLWAAAFLVCGVVFWLWLARFAPEDPELLEPVVPRAGRPRVLPLALVLPLAVGAWIRTTGGVFRPGAAALWIGAAAAWLLAWMPRRDPAATARGPERTNLPRPLALGILGAIVLLASFVYFHRLDSTPGNPTSDHAETLLDLSDVARGERPIFFQRNTGREPWKFYWLYALVNFFGLAPDFFATKVGTVTTALFAIPAMFLLGRELGGDRLGLFTAALLAWSKWPLAMARLGIRVSYVVLPTAMVLWALLRYLRRGDRASALWCGVWIGIGLYGYIPFRIVPVFVPIFLALAAFDRRWRGNRTRLLRDGAFIAVTAALVFLPLGHFATERPDLFFERMAERSGDLSRPPGPAMLAVFAENLRNMALAFNWKGDGGWVNFVIGDPFLDAVTSGLFLAGVSVAFLRACQGSIRWLVPLSGLFLLTLPSTLVFSFVHENPSVNRSAAAIPAVFLLAAAPLSYLAAGFGRLPAVQRIFGWAAIAAVLALSARESWRRYFVDYHRQYDLHVEHTTDMARAIRDHAARGVPLTNAYVLNDPHWIDPRNVAFELGSPGWAASNEVPPGEPPPSLDRRPLLFILRPADGPRREALRRTYPGGEERIVPQSFPDRNFSIYLVR